jgi:hypothetical protein
MPEDADRLAAELGTPAVDIPLHQSSEGSQVARVIPEATVMRIAENRPAGEGPVLAEEATRSAEVEQVADAVAQAAGKPTRRGRGQGFQLDQDVKVAIEMRAMNAAIEFYGEGWTVRDVHGNESYDLICNRGDEEKHVEVKGTTTDGTEVVLTPNEVGHAREYPSTALFILSNIAIARAEDGAITATGGEQHLYDPWHIGDGTLTPLGFRYQLPDQ